MKPLLLITPLLFLLASCSASDVDLKDGPYLRGGQICTDQLHSLQETKYDEKVTCRVKMEPTCSDPISREGEDEDYYMDQSCHTMYKKECNIRYVPRMREVKMRVCSDGREKMVEPEGRANEPRAPAVLDVRPSNTLSKSEGECVGGKRKLCVKKYQTECYTRQRKHEMMEDRPRCRVKLVERCNEGRDCRKVPMMRCEIEKQMVTKTMPETKCERIPREFCRKVACEEEAKEKCYFKVKKINEIVPEEKCSLKPHRMCHPVRKSRSRRVRLLKRDAGHFRQCRMAPKQRCQRRKVNPRPVTRQMRKTVCRDPGRTQEDVALFRELMERKAAEEGGDVMANDVFSP